MNRYVIFHCYGGAHSSVTSAGIYLGLLPRNRVPSMRELLTVPHYDGEEPIPLGHFRFMGRDQRSRAVFVLGKHMMGPPINRLMAVIAGIYGCAGNVFSVDTTAFINVLMVIGGYTSRVLKLVRLGRPIVVLGTKLAYFKFVGLAHGAGQRLQANCCVEAAPLPAAARQKSIFYLCPEGFRYSLLVAGCHVLAGASEESLLCWARQQNFIGAIGSVLYVGAADGYQVYVVGVGREPGLAGRVIRELRYFLDVPQSHCLVVEPAIQSSLLGVLARKGSWCLRLSHRYDVWEERLFRKYMNICQRSSNDVKVRIEEGILD
ncbi:MAG: DUF3189 family protein [Thermacetogeniaceae bacterium]